MKAVTTLLRDCIECGICSKQCSFLRESSNPKVLVAAINEDTLDANSLYGCTLCGLCTQVCPKDIDIPTAFIELKRAGQPGIVCRSVRPLLQYQKIQSSKILSLRQFPQKADTVFFPGCSFATTRGNHCLGIYTYLQQHYPQIGVVLSCCGKPSHDFGLTPIFTKHFDKELEELTKNGISRIITTCPNCQYTFKKYSDLEVISLYEVLERHPCNLNTLVDQVVTVHDSCTARQAPPIHNAIRSIITAEGGKVKEMPHNKETAFCCGDGAATSLARPELAQEWQHKRHQEFSDTGATKLISYCAGCADKISQSSHILDLLFGDGQNGDSRRKPTMLKRYLKRYSLKTSFQKILP